jgi:hypothetical protein
MDDTSRQQISESTDDNKRLISVQRAVLSYLSYSVDPVATATRAIPATARNTTHEREGCTGRPTEGG